MKRFLAILMALIVLVGIAGCGEDKKVAAPEGEQKSFTYWLNMPAAIMTVYDTIGEMPMYQEAEKRTGIHIDFIHPPVGQANEQFNLMVVSQDLPDMVEMVWSGYPGGPGKAISDGVILKLNDYIENGVVPNYAKLVSDGVNKRQSVTDAGEYFAFNGIDIETDEKGIYGGIMIRKDWLDDLNLPVPETLEEWETTLRAFKEKKGAKAPFTGDPSLFSTTSSGNTFNNAFDVGKGLYIDNDVVKFGPLEPAYKEWIATMNRWYEEGLIDPDYSTNSMDIMNAKMTNGDSGARFGTIGAVMGLYLGRMQGTDPKYNLVGTPYPVKEKGMTARFVDTAYDVSEVGAAITTACKSPEGAAKWLDYWYSEEGSVLKSFGIEGVTYNLVDGKHVYTDLILKNPDGLTVAEMLKRNMRVAEPTPGLRITGEYLEQYYQFQQQKDAYTIWGQSAEAGLKTYLPMLTPTSDEAEELAALSTDIKTYVEEMVLKFVTGSKPMSEFDSFVTDLKTGLNIDRYLEIYQGAYDRYKDR